MIRSSLRAFGGAALSTLTIAIVGLGIVALEPRSSDAGTPDALGISRDLAKAEELYQAGNYDQAIVLLEQDEARYRSALNVERDENYAALIAVLANAYQAKGRYAAAESLYKHSLAIREQVLGPNSSDVAADLNNLAELYRIEGRLAEAEPLYRRAVAILEKAVGPEDPSVAQCLSNLALLYVNLGRFAEAEPLQRRALAIRQKALGSDHPDVAASLTNLGELYQRFGRYSEAEVLYKHAAAIFEKALGPEHPNLAICLTDLANLYADLGRFAEAEPLHQRALAIREKVLGPDHPMLSLSLDGLGELYRLQGRYADAEPLYKRAVAILEKAFGPGYQDIGISLTGLANLYTDEGRYGDAEALDRRVITIQEKALGPRHPSIAPSLNNLAEVYRRQHGYADAAALYEQAAAVLEKAFGPDYPGLAAPLSNLALVYTDQGRLAEAESLYRRALAIRQKALGPDHFAIGESLNNLGQLYQTQGRYSDAELLLKRALAIFEKALGPDHSDVGLGLNNLAQLYDLQGRFADALPLAQTATERGFVSRQVHLSALEGAYTAGSVAAADAVDESFAVAQLAASSAASVALGQLATRFAAGSGNLARLVRGEQDLASADDHLDQAIIEEISKASADRSHDREQALRDELAKTAKALADVRAELSSRFPEYVALSKPQVIALADAQALLGEDEALVVVDPASPDSAGDHDYVWALTRDTAFWGTLATKNSEIADEVATLRAELDPHGDKAFDADLSYRLYRQTFGKAENVFAGKHQLLVVLSGALTGLPPQVLITADPAGKTPRSYDWLIRHYSVTVLPSVSSLAIPASARAKSAAERPMAGYGDPVFGKGESAESAGTRLAVNRDYGSYYRGGLVADVAALRRGLPALPETAVELQSVAKSVGADPADIKLGSAATVTAVKEARLDQYRIIYFATHALVAGEVAQVAKIKAEPALALSLPDQPSQSDDGLLKASEVAELKLDADIVVLSACNTAAGDKPGAEALSGLARAFFYAGARSLIVSHWPVKSDATVKLMTSTFSAMAADRSLTPAQALREAMLALIDNPNDADAANPTFWAPFIVVGGARSPR